MSDLAALYQRWLVDMWAADDDALDQLAAEILTPGFVIHQAGAEYPTGPTAAAGLIRQGRAPFRDIEVGLVVGPVVDGDLVAARWTFRGTYVGGIPGTGAPVGRPVAFGGNDILRAEDGKFAEYWVSSDGLDLMQQLGA